MPKHTHKPGCFQLVLREREHSGKEMSYFSVGSSRKVAKSCLMALFTLHHGAERQGDRARPGWKRATQYSQSVAMRGLGRRFRGQIFNSMLKTDAFLKTILNTWQLSSSVSFSASAARMRSFQFLASLNVMRKRRCIH